MNGTLLTSARQHLGSLIIFSTLSLLLGCVAQGTDHGDNTPPAIPTAEPTTIEATLSSGSLGPMLSEEASPRASREPTPTVEPTMAEIYTDAMAEGWSNWSWGVTVNFQQKTQAHTGTTALAVTYDNAWSAFYLHVKPLLSLADYDKLSFWIHGGTTGERKLRVVLADGSNAFLDQGVAVTAPAGEWTLVEIPLVELGAPLEISGIAWQDATGEAQPTLYLDDVQLVGIVKPPPEPIPGPGLHVDTTSPGHTIRDEIYGMNFADEALARELNLPLNRSGGNAATRYNWQLDVSNRASDWYFENIPNEVTDPSALPEGSGSDRFVSRNQKLGVESILTMPLIGWTPKDREVRCGFSVARYGPQQKTDPQRPDCGNGIQPDGTPITGNDPTDTSRPVGPSFVQEWLRHLVSKFGDAASGGVRYYALDNEPMLWHETHRDVHPQPVSYDEILERSLTYGAAIKEIDPTAQILGPVVWGWTAYFHSGVDLASDNWDNPPDRNAHGGTPFVPWYLQQMQRYEQTNGTRILDYLDLHFYPQAPKIALSRAGGAETRALRLRSTRALWDQTYVDESWIDEPVMLIPRMQQWVDENYPGTGLALTEYNWGGLEHINGALTQAEILGIFGREGLDLASLWSPPEAGEPGAFAFRLYRNYDGQNSTFGDVSLPASSEDHEQLSIYAARRSGDGVVTIVVINKGAQPLISNLALTGVKDGTSVERYQYSPDNLTALERLTPAAISAGELTLTFPGNSMTLLEVADDS